MQTPQYSVLFTVLYANHGRPARAAPPRPDRRCRISPGESRVNRTSITGKDSTSRVHDQGVDPHLPSSMTQTRSYLARAHQLAFLFLKVFSHDRGCHFGLVNDCHCQFGSMAIRLYASSSSSGKPPMQKLLLRLECVLQTLLLRCLRVRTQRLGMRQCAFGRG